MRNRYHPIDAGIPLEDDMWLVTMDVESLYTSIHHTDGIAAVEAFLDLSEYNAPFKRFLLRLLRFALGHNYFTFKGGIYLQKQGTAMGAAYASSYANLFLGQWEENIFFAHPIAHIEGALLWARYIDDVLLIWQGQERDLLAFVDVLNDNNLNIKLTCKYSRDNIDFLDVLISKGYDGMLETNIFRKEVWGAAA